LGYILSPSAYSNTKRKKVKPEGNINLQKTYHNWTKAKELQKPCFKQDTKANQRWFKAMWTLCTLWLLCKKITNPWYQMFHNCWLKPKLSRWTNIWLAQILAFTKRLVWYIMNRAGLRGGNGSNCPASPVSRGPPVMKLFVSNEIFMRPGGSDSLHCSFGRVLSSLCYKNQCSQKDYSKRPDQWSVTIACEFRVSSRLPLPFLAVSHLFCNLDY